MDVSPTDRDCPPPDEIAAYVAGELTGGAAADFERHLAQCSSCAQTVALLNTAVPPPEPASPESLPPGTAIDRYQLLGAVGKGAFGVVYAAYDPRLDRKVALKVLRRPRAQDEERLLREARAMARVSSPHVVTVHDVGTFAGTLYIAMDFIDGQTLRQWLAAAPRDTREILAAFVQAGRGLAAAHAAGIVHRDFKPENVLVRADGRVAVTDFGLARTPGAGALGASAEIAAVTGSSSAAPPQLTADGAIVGTPLYMSPEQRRGAAADARSDMFAFCVALYAALFRRHPYPTDDGEALARAVTVGPAPPPRDAAVPRHVRDAVLAGLRPRAAERPASMGELLRALEHDPRRRRAGLALAGAATVALAVAVVARPTAAPPPPLCRGGEHKLAGIWDGDRRAAVHRGILASGSPLAAGAVTSIDRAFDAYAARWVGGYSDACEATRVRGEQSEALLDRRMECLDDLRRRWAALARALEAPSAPEIQRAIVAAHDLPPVDACADPRRLALDAIDVPLVERPLVVLARGSIARSHALSSLGRFADARAEAGAALAVAGRLGQRALEAEARLAEHSALVNEDRKAAEETLHAAAIAALASGRIDLEARARVKLVRLAGETRQLEVLRRAADYAQAAVDRLGDELLRGELYFGLAISYVNVSHPELALPFGVLAQAVWQKALGADDARVGKAWSALQFVYSQLGENESCLAANRHELAIYEKVYDRDHPEAIRARGNLGFILYQLGRYEEALTVQLDAVAAHERVLGPEHFQTAQRHQNLAILYLHGWDRFASAIDEAQRGLAIRVRRFGETDLQLVESLTVLAEAQAMAGQLAEADAATARAVAITDKLPDDDFLRLNALSRRGVVLAAAGRHAEAIALLERALRAVQTTYDRATASVILLTLGDSYLARGDLARAALALERTLAIREEQGPIGLADVLVAVARLRRAQRRDTDARAAAERALPLVPATRPVLRAEALFELAQASQPPRRRELAEQALETLRARPEPLALRARIERWLARR